MKQINYQLASSSWGEEEVAAIYAVIKNDRYTMGEKVQQFEKV